MTNMLIFNMFYHFFLNLSLNKKLILMMLFLSFILITVLMFLYAHSERALISEFEAQTRELTKAIQIGVEEVTAIGSTDEARLSKYLKELNAKGVKEISIISNADEIVASTAPEKIGQPITHKRKELIIKAELGEPISEEGRTYNVILPVIADNIQYGYIHLKVNKDDFTSILKTNALKRIVATIFVFGIGILMTIILTKRYTQPIHDVVNAAMRVSAGDLNQNITVKSKDEIGLLSESFNYMVQKLRENRNLEEKLREAEHLSGLGQLSRDMAHEIRNPLNFINLSIGHIAEKYRPAEQDSQKKFDNLIEGIKQEVQRLNKLVNDFLDYSKPLKIVRKMVPVEDLLEDVFALIWAKAEADGIRIIKEYHAKTEIYVDADLLKSCILNVITNAFHALGTGSDQDLESRNQNREKILKIKTEIIDREFVLTISDNGEGVAPENISWIFEPFFSTKQNGLGLGLPMTRKVMEEHRGRVEFHSTVGQGSEVRLIIPIN